jgi:hypothetical protein
MAAPALKPRKVFKDHNLEVVEFQEVIEAVHRKVGYGGEKPPWQKLELRDKRDAERAREKS